MLQRVEVLFSNAQAIAARQASMAPSSADLPAGRHSNSGNPHKL
jgi:hypothetical protein